MNSPEPTALAVGNAVATVRALIEAGLLDPASLGGPAAPAAPSSLVPGKPIRMRKLAEKALKGLPENTRRTYATYIDILVDGWPAAAPKAEKLYKGMGKKWAHEVLPSDLEHALVWVERRAQVGSHWRAERRQAVGRAVRASDGSGAKYNAVGAWRRMFATAVKDRHLAAGMDPAQKVRKPKRSGGSRRPLKDEQMEEFWAVVSGAGNDPVLDAMLCETILVSGARREGILNLELAGIDLDECTVRLDEKFGKVVNQPVPDWFAAKLHAFAVSRGATAGTDKVFRTRQAARGAAGAPITSRRFDYVFQRLQAACEWADRAQVSAHVLRHHAIALVERSSSKAVALAFARHEPEDTNDRYGRASAKEVAQAVVRLHGGTHPWTGPPAATDPATRPATGTAGAGEGTA